MNDLFNLSDIKDKLGERLSGDIIEAATHRIMRVTTGVERVIEAQRQAYANHAEVVDITSRLAVSDMVEEPPMPVTTTEVSDLDVPSQEDLEKQNLAAEARQKIEWQHREAA